MPNTLSWEKRRSAVLFTCPAPALHSEEKPSHCVSSVSDFWFGLRDSLLRCSDDLCFSSFAVPLLCPPRTLTPASAFGTYVFCIFWFSLPVPPLVPPAAFLQNHPLLSPHRKNIQIAFTQLRPVLGPENVLSFPYLASLSSFSLTLHC